MVILMQSPTRQVLHQARRAVQALPILLEEQASDPTPARIHIALRFRFRIGASGETRPHLDHLVHPTRQVIQTIRIFRLTLSSTL